MRTAGRVGVGNGAGVSVAVGVCVAVALGDGVTVDGIGAEAQAAKESNNAMNRIRRTSIFVLHKERFHFESLG
jgi:hypothetical protein